jgi:hypothetical protein
MRGGDNALGEWCGEMMWGGTGVVANEWRGDARFGELCDVVGQRSGLRQHV